MRVLAWKPATESPWRSSSRPARTGALAELGRREGFHGLGTWGGSVARFKPQTARLPVGVARWRLPVVRVDGLHPGLRRYSGVDLADHAVAHAGAQAAGAVGSERPSI